MSTRRIVAFTVCALLAAAGAAVPPLGSSATAAPAGPRTAHSCTTSPPPGYATCDAIRRTDVAGPLARPDVVVPNVGGFGPVDIRSAYKLPSFNHGTGHTIAIVDAFNDPKAESDMGTYRSNFGLPACTTANGCFKKVNQNGGTSYPSNDSGWAEEISLDLDMASAVCPLCHIILVESASSLLSSLETGVAEAGALGATTISLSWGAFKLDQQDATNSPYHQAGVPIVASSGDSGVGVQYPAASRYVIAAGGTSLFRDGSARQWTESAWSGAGSGCSGVNPAVAPTSFDTGCPDKRAFADLSAVADPNTGVAVYDSFNRPGWAIFGGTSAAAPIIAAAFDLIANPSLLASPQAIYAVTSSAFYDVTTGSNGSCAAAQVCHARVGWDGPTGRGSLNFSLH